MNHFYPGMGATASMYGTPWKEAYEDTFHNWPDWKGERTVTDLAKRLIEEDGVARGDTIFGTSLGGIVACEIANLIDLDRIVLIGSALEKEEINGTLEHLHPLIDLTPMKLVQISSGKLPGDLSAMFSDSDPDFIRSMSKAIFSWNGLNSKVPVTRIHGTKDRIIPLPKNVNYEIDGGHLIVMTHPVECIKYLQGKSIGSGNAG
ncbi:MAG: alpha/beta hydrolase [Verrucomicrobiota bacterium]